VASARAQLAQARADLEQAKRNRARADELFKQNAISSNEHENALTAFMVGEARVRAAESQLAAQEANAVVARTNLDHAIIRAPIDGVVITRNIDPGQTVASMLATPTLFTVAADLRHMEVVGAVDEGDVGEVKPEQQVSFTVTAYPDRVFKGVVVEVRNAARIVQDVVTYGAVVAVDNDDLSLKPGMTASLRVKTAEVKGVDSVPNAALHFTPPGQERPSSGHVVWVLDGETPRAVPVEVGISDGEWTEVHGGGLTAGQVVLIDLTPKGKVAYGIGKPP
jgi:HlyD family secretion protein